MRFCIRPIGLVGHRVAVVDHEHVQTRPLRQAIAASSTDRTRAAAPAPSPIEQQQTPRRQQQPLLKLQPPAVLPHRPQQEIHRRPLHRLEPPAVEDVDDDRNRRKQQPRDEERRRDEATRSEDVGSISIKSSCNREGSKSAKASRCATNEIPSRFLFALIAPSRSAFFSYFIDAARVARNSLSATSSESPLLIR